MNIGPGKGLKRNSVMYVTDSKLFHIETVNAPWLLHHFCIFVIQTGFAYLIIIRSGIFFI